ncbi:jg2778 [Pararge aegeria aegeria]|uniref:Jg2778 protein n=1 Tax=Pararge aegeria aegeria TaxID=348720 RepID=A0A8S4QRP3_9NEOP|nr:jg2778 [Pararge aegeria aegeria]
MKEVILAIITFVCSVFLVLIFVLFCWYVVWKCCLSKFRFVRELLGGMSDTPPASEIRQPKQRKSRRE